MAGTRISLFGTPAAPNQCGSKGVLGLGYTGRSLPAGGARLALIRAAGRGRREVARGSVSIRDAKFLLWGGGGGAASSPPGGAEAGGRRGAGWAPAHLAGPKWGWSWEGRPGLGRVAPPHPPWGASALRIPPTPRARTPGRPLAQRFHHPTLPPREMLSTFPLSLQPLDCPMRLCIPLGVCSTAPFLPRRADITHSVFWLGLVGRWLPAGSEHL